jgi:NAD(P)-dependent dehydrogenase (short-subunit alcohol dehydrogenase family)
MWDNQVAQQAAAESQYFASEPEAVARQMIEAIPLRRYGSPSEVAEVVRFLVDERSSYLTGVNIEIAGGAL